MQWLPVIIADTGLWVGLADRHDRCHEVCRRFVRRNRETLITTFPVLIEAVHILFDRVGVSMNLAWLETLEAKGIKVFQPDFMHLKRMTDLMRQYADLPMDLADASLVVLAEHLGSGRIVSTDCRDFHAYR